MRLTRHGTLNHTINDEGYREPIKDLMHAILFECLRDIAKPTRSFSNPKTAYRWFKSNEHDYIFSCKNICEVLDLDYDFFYNIDAALPLIAKMFEESDQVSRKTKQRGRNELAPRLPQGAKRLYRTV